MDTMKKMIFNNEKGFALLAAIIASLILMAVGLLVVNMSGGDLRTSSVTVGDKKALAATETGVHRVIHDFAPPAPLVNSTDCTPASPSWNWQSISSGASAGIDANTQYAVCAPTASVLTPLSYPGYAMCGDPDGWCLFRYNGSVVGNNTSYHSLNRVNIGIGFGPIK